MTTDTDKRLAEIRRNHELCLNQTMAHDDRGFLLAEIERRDKAMIQFFRWLDDASEPYPSILTDYSQSKQGKTG